MERAGEQEFVCSLEAQAPLGVVELPAPLPHPQPQPPISPPRLHDALHDALQPRDEAGRAQSRVIPVMAQDMVQQLAWLMLL